MARPGAIIAFALAATLSGGAAHAAGTLAGTDITNLATLNYSVGSVNQSPIGSSATGNTTGAGTATSFRVDNKVNLTVTTSDTGYVSVVPGQTLLTATASQVATFSVTNNGNSTQDFSLTSLFNYTGATSNVFGGSVTDTFNPSACSIRVEKGTTAGYQAAEDTATFIDELAPDSSKTVYVICAIPLAQIDGDIAAISLTAEARAGGTVGTEGAALVQTTGANTEAVAGVGGIDIVFADAAGTDDIARDAKSSSRDAFKVVSAKLKVTKTVTPVCDPFNGNALNGAKNIPGSFVRYTISIENTGSASATLSSISDTLTSVVIFDPDLIKIDQALAASPANSAATAAACVSGVGSTPESATGKGFKIVNPGRLGAGGAYPKYLTSTADADGADSTAGTITVNFATVLPATDPGSYTAGELKATETVSVIYQVKIN
jgi:hypothetical protein